MSNQQLAIMFADVSGSSRLYKAVGDELARALISEAVVRMLRAVNSHGGTLIKTIGDEVMARFPSAAQGLLAAVAMQRDAEMPIDGQMLPLRIGVNFGATLLENNDVFGEAVNDAAALVKIARARQIVTNASTLVHAPAELQSLCTVFDRVILKGGRDEEDISLVRWESPETTGSANATTVMGVVDTSTASPIVGGKLQLVYLGQNFAIAPELTPFHIGRDPAKCQLIIDSSFSSRDHSSIEYRRGKYVLVDHSTNGTYVQMRGHQDIYLRREEVPMTGSGEISIGQPLGTAPELTIVFEL